MKLRKLKIKNYRCFGSETEINFNNINAFVGDNGTGKTAALSALNCMFSNRPIDRILTKNDFNLGIWESKDSDRRRELSIEAVFLMDELLKESTSSNIAIPTFFEHLTVSDDNGDLILRIRLEASWEKSSGLDGSIESKIYFITCGEDEEDINTNKVEAKRSLLDQIRFIYVPAVRNPSSQIKNVSGTLLNQILQKLNWNENTKLKVDEMAAELNKQLSSDSSIEAINKNIEKTWNQYSMDNSINEAHISFNGSNLKKMLSNTGVSFSSEYFTDEISLDDLSDGLKSVFYISLVESVLETEDIILSGDSESGSGLLADYRPPVLTIIALEEPENHIAPHRLGKLVLNLRNLSSKFNSQVILTSHSSSIMKRIQPEEIRYLRKDDWSGTTEVHELTLPDDETEVDQYKFVKGAVQAYPEIYFSKLVILGEGDSEELILPKVWESINKNVDIDNVSIVPLGGRHVNHFWRLLNNLHIPFVTLLDLDRERSGGGWGRIHYAIDQLIKNGGDKSKLLTISDKQLTDEEFEEMQNWPVKNIDDMNTWLNHLESFNVFYSAPLDIDFLMLENWTDYYIDYFPFKHGPSIDIGNPESSSKSRYKVLELPSRIIDQLPQPIKDAYLRKIAESVRATLKKDGGSGETYSEEQKELMVWYVYHFLNRGKPATHIQALTEYETGEMVYGYPPVLERLCRRGNELINDDYF